MALEANVTAVRTLVSNFKANIAGITDVLEEFPNPNQDLNYPSISIITKGDVEHVNWMPSVFKKPDNVIDPNKADVVYIVGQYNFSLQVDLWTEYKPQRAEFFQKILDAFDKQFIDSEQPTGLSLVLDDYHGGIARYDQVGYNYLDNESESQRNEWRAIFDVLVSFPRLLLKTQPKIIEGQINSNVSVEEFDDDNEETKVVF